MGMNRRRFVDRSALVAGALFLPCGTMDGKSVGFTIGE